MNPTNQTGHDDKTRTDETTDEKIDVKKDQVAGVHIEYDQT